MTKKRRFTEEDAVRILESVFGVKAASPAKPAPPRRSLKERAEAFQRSMTPQEREIIDRYFSPSGEPTKELEQIVKVFKATRERIRQIELNEIRKLGRRMEAKKLKGGMKRKGKGG